MRVTVHVLVILLSSSLILPAAQAAPIATTADLVASNPRIDGAAREGALATALATVTNAGNASAPTGFRVAFYVNDVRVASQTYPAGMPAGYVLEVAASFEAPLAGAHELKVLVDADATMMEPDEANNWASAPFTTHGPGPNLAAREPRLPLATDLIEGRRFPAEAVPQNAGSTAVTVPITSELLLDGVLVARQFLPAGFPSTEAPALEAEIGPLALGAHTLTLRVDVHDNFTEIDAGDNERSVHFVVLEGADLHVDNLVVSQVTTPWGAADPLGRHVAELDVCNRRAPTTLAFVAVYLESRAAVNTSWTVHSAPLQLARGECSHLRVAFDAWGVVGDFRVVAHTDAMNEVFFSDNTASVNASRLVAGHGGVTLRAGDGPLGAPVRNVENSFQGGVPGNAAAAVANATYTNPVWRCADPAYANHVVCMQMNGEIGYGQVRACRPPAFPNLLATVAYTAGSIAFGAMEGATGHNPCQGGVARIVNETLTR